MAFEQRLVVSGKTVRLNPYSERRFELLVQIGNEIDEYIKTNPNVTFSDIDRTLRAKWWKRKADVLWSCDEPLDLEFFESKEFESSQLKLSEDLFFQNGLYL